MLLFGQRLHGLYFLALVCIAAGLLVYNCAPPPHTPASLAALQAQAQAPPPLSPSSVSGSAEGGFCEGASGDLGEEDSKRSPLRPNAEETVLPPGAPRTMGLAARDSLQGGTEAWVALDVTGSALAPQLAGELLVPAVEALHKLKS